MKQIDPACNFGLSRRGFLGLSAGVSAGLAFAANATFTRTTRAALLGDASLQDSAMNWFAWTKVSPRCWVAQGEGGNVLVIAGENEAIVIDAKNAGYGATLRREAEAVCGKPVKTLINTHHHGDHIGGNYAFTKDCAVMAHQNALPRIASQGERLLGGAARAQKQVSESDKPAKGAVLNDLAAFDGAGYTKNSWNPTKSLGDSETITIGGIELQLAHVGNGHTDNDLIIVVPRENVLHGGDLLFNRTWPVIDLPGGSDTAGWVKGCEKILELCGEKQRVVIPGHGDIGDREMAQRQRQMLIALRAKAAAAVNSGQSREDFLKRPFDEYAEYQRADVLKPRTLGGVYDEAMRAAGK
ncbi:MAG: MBL fold metallo-hydrolase [Phycisphaeraceae bacterium]|nr:MBL fold metallo-hydrolase [Phycisphaeraceae bacterium]